MTVKFKRKAVSVVLAVALVAAIFVVRLTLWEPGSATSGSTSTETGAIETGAIETGAIETGAIESGAIESGAIETGAIEYGAREAVESVEEAAITGGTESCSLDWVCVESRDYPDGSADFIAENLRAVPITVSLRVRGRNMVAQGPNPVTVTVPPNQRTLVTRMEPRLSSLGTWYRFNFDWAVGSRDVVHNDAIVYEFPYESGRRYRILQGYGSRFSHTGLEAYTIDFDMPVGTPVRAARGGVVARLVEEHDKGCWDDGCGAFANFVVVLHDDGTTGEYYHLARNGVLVDEGDRIVAGQLIALSGNTGHTTMPHLHFGVYRAATWGATESVPVRFRSNSGIVATPRRGFGHVAR